MAILGLLDLRPRFITFRDDDRPLSETGNKAYPIKKKTVPGKISGSF